MRKWSYKSVLKSTVLLQSTVVGAIAFTPAFAQDQQDQKVERVTVTGTRIPQKGLTSVSPVSTISNTDLKTSGTSSAETLLNDMPQVLANQSAEVANGASGTATLDLRGLGPKRTLVLINGKRLHPANIAAPTADLNNIPVAMIERVEILTGGASAVYGADAVAGVVNFIYRKDFEGLEIGGQYQINDHNNDDGYLRGLVLDAGFAVPDKHVSDGRVVTTWGVIGSNFADGKGNVTAYIQYRNAEALLQSERDFSACALATDLGGGFFCLGSSNSATGAFTSFSPTGAGIRFTASPEVPGTMRPFVAADSFNFNPLNYLQRPDDRYLLGFQGHYQIDENVDIYTEASFMDDRTVAQIAASGFFQGSGPVGGLFLVNCDNPFLQTGATEDAGATQFTPFNALCGTAAVENVGSTGTATVNIGRRFVETNLGRQDDFKTTSYRLVGGARGQIETWNYDIYAQYGTTSTPRVYLNDVSRSRAQRQILVVTDPRPTSPTFGQPICQSVLDGSDPSCVPGNIFSFGALTPGAIAFSSATGIQQTTTEEQVVNASINGEVGVTSPWATDAVSMAFGGEYRFTSLRHISDDVFKSGDLLGQGGATPDVTGDYDVWELFTEIQIPLVQDAPFAKLIQFDGGYRFSDYSNAAGTTDTYKLALSWMPIDDFRLRGSFQHAVRAPNVIELFTPATQGLFGGIDPCAATTSAAPFYNATQCANTGLSPAQYGLFAASPAFQCPAAQCSGPFAGNPNLKPESSDTKSFGFVFTPTFIKGFNATVDWFDIEIEDQITIISQTALLGNCATTGNPFSCDLINRDPVTGTIFNSTTLGVGVDSMTRNSGTQHVSGIDFEANYRFDMDDMFGWKGTGGLAFNFVGSWLDEFETNYGPGFDTFDCAGFYGLVCGLPAPEWKHRFRVTWSSPWEVDFSLAWRHLAGVSLDVNDGTNTVFNYPFNGPLGDLSDAQISSFDYLDVAVNWQITEYLRLIVGVNNITDVDPPVVDSQLVGISAPPFGNANTYPAVYDSFGRQAFISLTTRF